MAHETLTITVGLIETGETVKVTIEGESQMPFWNDDLKVTAILSLLNSIDIKHYHEANKSGEAYEAYNEIIETAKAAFGMDLFEFDE